MTTQVVNTLSGTYALDPARIQVGFLARSLGTKPRGQFAKLSGQVYLDFDDPARSSVDVTVDVASLTTGNKRRDAHLRSSTFFDAEAHPQLTFRGSEVRRLGHDRFQLTGDLTIKDHTRPVTIAVVRTDTDTGAGATRVRFEGQASVNRKDWGLGWGGVFINNVVTIEFDVDVVKTVA